MTAALIPISGFPLGLLSLSLPLPAGLIYSFLFPVDSTPPKPPRLRPRAPTTPPPPPPPAETVAAAAPEPGPEPKPEGQPKKSLFSHRIFRFGGEGLAASLVIHGLLLFLATVWVVSVAVIQKKEPNTFATGAGGGNSGERAIAQKTKVKPNAPKSLTKTASRITSKSRSAQIALPEMPDLSRVALGAMATSSKGFGGGAGGGIGFEYAKRFLAEGAKVAVAEVELIVITPRWIDLIDPLASNADAEVDIVGPYLIAQYALVPSWW